jgi:hypothetical protein
LPSSAPQARYIPMMSLLTELKIILRKIFYKYVVPTALPPPAGPMQFQPYSPPLIV